MSVKRIEENPYITFNTVVDGGMLEVVDGKTIIRINIDEASFGAHYDFQGNNMSTVTDAAYEFAREFNVHADRHANKLPCKSIWMEIDIPVTDMLASMYFNGGSSDTATDSEMRSGLRKELEALLKRFDEIDKELAA